MWQCEPQPRARRVDECGSASRSRRRGESMNDERGEIAVKLRVGVFVLVALAAFLGMVYALGARARLFEAHYTIHAEFTEVAGLTEGADTARDAAALVAALRKTAEDVNRSKLVDDVSATVGKINRVVDQVEHGRGWAHALLYEEPVALKRLNETVTTTQKLLDRVAEGQGPAGVLLSPTGTDAARRFVGAMDRLGRLVDRPGPTRASSRHSSSNRSIRRRSRTFALSRVTSATCPTGSPAGGARSALSSPTGTPAACARSFRTCGSRWRTSRRSAKRSRRARGRSARSSRIRRSTSGS